MTDAVPGPNAGARPLIDHVGVLVTDLEEAIATWAQVTGYSFTPVMSYRTDRYVDHSSADPHFHDARIAFSIEGPPFIELMEFTGEGTHAASQGEGFHHIGFRVPDPVERRDILATHGVGHDGASLDEAGQPILWFTTPEDLNGMRLEYIGPVQQPVYDADGELVVYDPDAAP